MSFVQERAFPQHVARGFSPAAAGLKGLRHYRLVKTTATASSSKTGERSPEEDVRGAARVRGA